MSVSNRKILSYRRILFNVMYNVPSMPSRESDNHQYHEAGVRMHNLERALEAQNSFCDMHMIGVEHVGEPPFELLDTLPSADIITLELGRGVVQAALFGEETRLLEKSPFWKKIMTTLQPHQEGKKIVGVEVNQTPRTAVRRFVFHHGKQMLTTPLLVVEKTGNQKNKLLSLLTEKELEALHTYHYIVTENEEFLYHILNRTEKVAKKQKGLTYPMAISDTLSIVSGNSEYDEETPSMAIIEPPHPSLTLAWNIVDQILTDSQLFTDERKRTAEAFNIIMNYLLTSVECTEAREIANAASQHVRSSGMSETLYTLHHVGGSFHSPILAHILDDLHTPNGRTTIQTTDLSSLDNEAHLERFIRDTVPFIHRLSAVFVGGSEVILDPNHIGQQVANALGHYGEKFLQWKESHAS
jgi:hypothetical protein